MIEGIYSFLFLTISIPSALLIDADTEKQFSPHLWSKRYKPDEALTTFLETIARSCNETRGTVPYEPDIRYGKGPRQTLDIYGADSLPEDAPLVVYLHGGYWQVQELTKNISCQIVHPLWKVGIRVMVAGYDLAPQVSLGDIIREVTELGTFAINYAKKYNIKKVWFVGHSVGSHLAASLLYRPWLNQELAHLLSGMVLITGVYDLSSLPLTSFNVPLKLDQITARQLSPIFEEKVIIPLSDTFKASVVTGEDESPEFLRQSRSFHDVLVKQGVKSEFHLLPGLDHFDIASNLQYENFVLTKNISRLVTQVDLDS